MNDVKVKETTFLVANTNKGTYIIDYPKEYEMEVSVINGLGKSIEGFPKSCQGVYVCEVGILESISAGVLKDIKVIMKSLRLLADLSNQGMDMKRRVLLNACSQMQ